MQRFWSRTTILLLALALGAVLVIADQPEIAPTGFVSPPPLDTGVEVPMDERVHGIILALGYLDAVDTEQRTRVLRAMARSNHPTLRPWAQAQLRD